MTALTTHSSFVSNHRHKSCSSARPGTISQSPCTALTAGICLPLELYNGTFSGRWKFPPIPRIHCVKDIPQKNYTRQSQKGNASQIGGHISNPTESPDCHQSGTVQQSKTTGDDRITDEQSRIFDMTKNWIRKYGCTEIQMIISSQFRYLLFRVGASLLTIMIRHMIVFQQRLS